MHPQIKRRLDTIESAGKANRYSRNTIDRIKGDYLKAMTTNRKAIAIKAFCRECMGYDAGLAESIRSCTDRGCPLYEHRPYQMKDGRPPEKGCLATLESMISENVACG
ncbi:hypothetical protein ACFL6U_31305 [Planctomycetota bacterium]